ncbi:MAG: flagellar basal body P-ring formation chaperone FlgA [bacterium]
MRIFESNVSRIASALVVFLLFAWAASGVTISLRDGISIGGEDVFLGHIASIEDASGDLIRLLQGVRLGNAPLPGRSQSFTARYIQMRILQNVRSLKAEDILFRGPNEVSVWRASATFESDRAVDQVIAYVAQNAPWRDDEMSIEVVRKPEDLAIPLGDVAYYVRWPKDEDFEGPVNVPVEVFVDGRVYRTIYVGVKIRVHKYVVVAKRDLKAKHVVDLGDVELMRQEVTGISPQCIYASKDVLGKRITTFVKSGTILLRRMIDEPLAIERGKTVNIIAVVGSVTVSALGQVRKGGRINDVIEVENLTSNKVIKGKVLDANNVLVTY